MRLKRSEKDCKVMDRSRKPRNIENGIDYTPKPLQPPPEFPTISVENLSSFLENVFRVQDSRESSASQISVPSLLSSMPSIPVEIIPPFEHKSIKHLFRHTPLGLKTSSEDFQKLTEEEPPTLKRRDVSMISELPETATLKLKETETFFFFELPSETEDLNTPEGLKVKESNERYAFITGPNSERKLADSETQTPNVYMKSRGTSLQRKQLIDQSSYINNWIMHDEYENQTSKSPHQPLDQTPSETAEKVPVEDQLSRIYHTTDFRHAARITLRNLATKTFLDAQKLFLGLETQDLFNPDFKYTYSLKLLWEHFVPSLEGRIVLAFSWNPVISNLLAVGYGPLQEVGDFESRGELIVWSMKNPQDPEARFELENPVSCLEWSRSRPSWIAVGFYNGIVQVIDVSGETTTIMRQSSRKVSPSYEPFWCVQWWSHGETGDEDKIFACNQDGQVLRFGTDENFNGDEIMRITRVEDNVPGVERCFLSERPRNSLITKNPAALFLRRHPTDSRIYFVGSDEGCIFRCSIHSLHHQKDSFLAHDGPVYDMEFSPYCPEIFLTCGADWITRVWLDGTTIPLLTFSTEMDCVDSACWCRGISTVFATLCDDKVSLWNIAVKTHEPVSVTNLSNMGRMRKMKFTENGKQLVISNDSGRVFVYHLERAFFPPESEQRKMLVEALEKALVGKSSLLEAFERKMSKAPGYDQ